MGLLDQVLGSLLGGNNGGAASPVQNVLMSLLSGNQGQGNQGQGLGMLGQLGQGLMNQGGGGQGVAGGLSGLLATFQQAGLGDVVQSWISNGPNQPVSPEQLHSAFGGEQVQAMANQAGLNSQDFLSQLSQHLPNVVNGLTPHGQIPDEGTVSV